MPQSQQITVTTLGGLREALASMADLPDETEIVNQVADRTGKAWNLNATVMYLEESNAVSYSMHHKDLITLPALQEQLSGSVAKS